MYYTFYTTPNSAFVKSWIPTMPQSLPPLHRRGGECYYIPGDGVALYARAARYIRSCASLHCARCFQDSTIDNPMVCIKGVSYHTVD